MIKNIEDTRTILNNLKLSGLHTVNSLAAHLGISVSALSNVMYSQAVGQRSLVAIWKKIEQTYAPEEIEVALADVGHEDLSAICNSLRTKVAELEDENDRLRDTNAIVQHALNDDLKTENKRLRDRVRELQICVEGLKVSEAIKTDIISFVDGKWREKFQAISPAPFLF
ncbi:FtsZ-binding cell division protein ZapB [Sinorhizobium fredii]